MNVRHDLGDGAWIDVRRNWLGGADVILDHLIETVDWHRGRRRMFDRMVDDPRLSRGFGPGDSFPDPCLQEIGARLHRRVPRRPVDPCGLNYYRDGSDSVAFHADRELRELDDTLVAIVTFGARRPFLVRPEGWRSIDRPLARGRRPARDGRRLPTRPRALGAEGPVGRTADAPPPGAGPPVSGQ